MFVRSIWRYPVKSIGGERLDVATVTELGIVGDRAWGVRDLATGNVLTARREPRLLLATARFDETSGRPVIDTPAGTLAGDPAGITAGLTAWLARPVELVAPDAHSGATYENPDDVDHESDWVAWTGPAGAFHDSARTRVSIVSGRSLGADDERRFRANLVIETDGADEDDWVERRVTVGTVVLDVRKQIDRCIMVTRAQPGLPADREVLRRVIRERGNLMGIGALVDAPGTIRVGDAIGVT